MAISQAVRPATADQAHPVPRALARTLADRSDDQLGDLYELLESRREALADSDLVAAATLYNHPLAVIYAEIVARIALDRAHLGHMIGRSDNLGLATESELRAMWGDR